MTASSVGDGSERVAFLVGAGRSGTTLLYKLLCLHARIAFISNYDNRMPWLPSGLFSRLVANRTESKLNAWFNRGGNAYFLKRPLLKKMFPTPVEGESVYAACGVPLFPEEGAKLEAASCECLRNRFESIRHTSRSDIVLSKRTANNRRIPLLHGVFPQARYIHLIRDGREVAHSLSRVEWWDKHTLWWDGRTPEQLEKSGDERLSICAKNWALEMKALSEGLASVPDGQILEIRYEQLLSQPDIQLDRIIAFLGLSVTASYRSAIESLQLSYRPGSWLSDWNEAQLGNVLREEEHLLAELGYI